MAEAPECLIQISREQVGKRFTYTLEKGWTSVGRDKEHNHIVLADDLRVSSEHVKIWRWGNTIWLIDRSTNGTRLDGRELRRWIPTHWSVDQQLQIQSYTLSRSFNLTKQQPVATNVKTNPRQNTSQWSIGSFFQTKVKLPFWILLLAIILIVTLYWYLLPRPVDEGMRINNGSLYTPVPTFTPTPQLEATKPSVVEQTVMPIVTPALGPPPSGG